MKARYEIIYVIDALAWAEDELGEYRANNLGVDTPEYLGSKEAERRIAVLRARLLREEKTRTVFKRRQHCL